MSDRAIASRPRQQFPPRRPAAGGWIPSLHAEAPTPHGKQQRTSSARKRELARVCDLVIYRIVGRSEAGVKQRGQSERPEDSVVPTEKRR